MKKLFETNDSFGPFAGRVLLAITLFPHGAQKMLGLFGGHGFNTTMQMFTDKMHIPAPLAALAICTEFFGPILLLLGLLTRVSALGIGILMTVAVLTVHLPNGFFMNWTGQQAGEGFEYHILMFALSLVLMIQGGGKFAIDSLIARKLGESRSERHSGRTAAAHA